MVYPHKMASVGKPSRGDAVSTNYQTNNKNYVKLKKGNVMETKTEVGKILKKLNYKDNIITEFDNLALHLYSIPMEEKDELIAVLMWYCSVMKNDGTIRKNYKHHIENYDKLLSEINK